MAKIKLLITLIAPGALILMAVSIALIFLFAPVFSHDDWQLVLIRQSALIILAVLAFSLIIKIYQGIKQYLHLRHFAYKGESIQGRVSQSIPSRKNHVIISFRWWDEDSRTLHSGRTQPHPIHIMHQFQTNQSIPLQVLKTPQKKAMWKGELNAFLPH